MAAKKIEIILDVNGKPIDVAIDSTLNLKQQFRELTKEINKAGQSAENIQVLSAKLGDVKDQLEATGAKSKDLFGSLSLLPGPVGAFAGTVDGAIGTLKTFTSFSFKDLKFQLNETLKDFGDIASNIGKATGITKIYTTLNNALAKSFVAVGVGEEAAALGARAFSAALVATGIGALIVGLGMAYEALKELITGEEALKAATDAANKELETQSQLLNLDLADAARRQKKRLSDLKAGGATESEIRKQQTEDLKENLKITEAALQENYASQNKIMKSGVGDLKKAQEDGLKLEQKIKDLKADIYVAGQNDIAENNKAVAAKTKEAQQKLEAANKQHQEKIKADNKAADDTLRDLRRENAALAISDERARQDKELENQKLAEEEKIKSLEISQEKKNTILAQIELKYKSKQSDVDKKRKEDDIKAEEDFIKKVAEIKIAAIEDETNRTIAEREQKYNNDLADLEKDKEFIKKSEAEKAEIRKNLAIALENDVAKIKFDARMKAAEEELALLEATQKTLQEGTQAYLDNSIKIENEVYRQKIENAKGNAKKIEAINIEHEQNLKDIKLRAAIAEKQIQLDRLNVIAGIGNSLATLAGKNKALAIAAIAIEKAAAIGSIIVNTQIANLKAVAASPLTFGQPWVAINTIAGGLAVAATIASGIKAISDINAVQVPSANNSTSSANAEPAARPQGYAKGGLIGGRRHAQGGTLIEAEQGEAIMTRGAVSLFGPLLSNLNQMGGGTRFGNLSVASYDNPKTAYPSDYQQNPVQIVKTYVVEGELTSQQQKQARLKELSTI